MVELGLPRPTDAMYMYTLFQDNQDVAAISKVIDYVAEHQQRVITTAIEQHIDVVQKLHASTHRNPIALCCQIRLLLSHVFQDKSSFPCFS